MYQPDEKGRVNSLVTVLLQEVDRFNKLLLVIKVLMILRSQYCVYMIMACMWHSGSTLVSINEVTLHQALLVLGWVTGAGFNSWCQKPISVYNQIPRSTQPGHPFVNSRNEYYPKGSEM